VHATQVVPAVLLLAAALALGLAPGLVGGVEEAAERFTDRPAYAAAVLQGAVEPAPAGPHTPVHLAGPAVLAVTSALLGVGLALAALFPRHLPAGVRTLERAWAPAVAALRGMHSGYIADSVTWLVVGLSGLGGLLALVLR
jgi:multicomponent Na+:H+ antiporter subunit D